MIRGIGLSAAIAALVAAAASPSPARAQESRDKPVLGPQGPDVLIGVDPRGRKPPKPRRTNNLLVAIDTPYQIFRGQGSYVHVAAWTTSGRPASGASVFAGGVEVGKTDRHGTLVFVYPPKGGTRDDALGANTVTVVRGGQRGTVPFSPYLRTASFASDQLFVYTDRGVYRPGEKVRIRCIAWHLKQDYAPVGAGKTIEIRLQGPGGKVVGGGTARTDAFGIASLDIDVARTVEEGLYDLTVAYGKARESTRLQIREFKPPQIRLEHDLGRFITADQKQLAFQLTLAAATGPAVDRADVVLRVEAGKEEAFKLERAVVGAGPHRFAIDADQLAAIKKRLKEGQFATLELSIRDSRSRTANLRREMRFTANPYVAVLETDKDQYTTGDPVEIVAKISDLDGVPLRNKKVTLRVDGTVVTATTSDKGMAQLSLTMPKKSATAELYVAGVGKAIARATLRWVATRPMSSHIAEAIIKEQGSASVRVVFPSHIVPAEKVVHMDVTDTSGAIVNAVLLPVTKTRDGYVAEGSFKAPTWGSMLLTFFALGRDTREKRRSHQLGLLTEGQNLVVHPDRELTITLDGLPDKAEPGDELALNLKVTDPRGAPVRASIGLMAVDRRVLSLKDPLEVTPMDQLYDPKLRTMSTTGSKILSWPVVSRNWGGRRHDVALPPFPYLEGGPMSRPRPRRSSKTSSKSSKKPATKNDGYLDDDDDLDGEIGVGGYGTIGHGSGTGSGYGAGAGKSAGSGRGRASARPVAPPPKITIRTKFPETFLWKPHLVAEGGNLKVSAALPHAVGEQELVIVASDARGGVGVARKRVKVDQEVFVQADFPEVLRAGEKVAVPVLVTNNSGRALAFDLAMGGTTKKVSVPAGGSGGAMFEVGADRPGVHRFELSATAPGFRDLVRGSARVAPGGAPHALVVSGQASSQRPFRADFEVPADGAARASLSVAFPAVTSAFLGVSSLSQLLSDDPLAVASDLQSAAMVLQYAKQHRLRSSELDRLDRMVRAALDQAVAAQADDGSFAFWRNGASSPYVTAWVLEGMLAARRAGIRVPDKPIRQAAAWLADQMKGDRIEIVDISWWEGDSARVQLGLTAEVFDVLTQVPKYLLAPNARRVVERLSTIFSDYLERESDLDPLTAGRAIQGLARTGQLGPGDAKDVIARLVERRDKGHWEPSWFHAFGGNVEATVAVLAAMQLLDPAGYQVEKRDALSWILSTRDAWGQWHNERGTAQAIRALLLVGAPPEEVPGTVTVEVDGKIAHTVKIDPKDPFLSAIRLSQVDIGDKLAPGVHTVVVRYDGKLAPAATVAVQTWKRADGPRASGTVAAGPARVWSTAPPRLEVGQPVDVRVELARPRAAAASLLIPASTLVEVDLQKLARTIERNPSAVRYRLVPQGVLIDFAPGERVAIAIPFEGARAGTGPWPTLAVTVEGTTLRTSPGALHVE